MFISCLPRYHDAITTTTVQALYRAMMLHRQCPTGTSVELEFRFGKFIPKRVLELSQLPIAFSTNAFLHPAALRYYRFSSGVFLNVFKVMQAALIDAQPHTARYLLTSGTPTISLHSEHGRAVYGRTLKQGSKRVATLQTAITKKKLQLSDLCCAEWCNDVRIAISLESQGLSPSPTAVSSAAPCKTYASSVPHSSTLPTNGKEEEEDVGEEDYDSGDHSDELGHGKGERAKSAWALRTARFQVRREVPLGPYLSAHFTSINVESPDVFPLDILYEEGSAGPKIRHTINVPPPSTHRRTYFHVEVEVNVERLYKDWKKIGGNRTFTRTLVTSSQESVFVVDNANPDVMATSHVLEDPFLYAVAQDILSVLQFLGKSQQDAARISKK